MQKWENMQVRDNVNHLTEKVNELGRFGWEVINVVLEFPVQDLRVVPIYRAFLKRPIQED